MPDEIWKSCTEDPAYEISSLGRARTRTRVITNKDGISRTWPGKMLKPGATKSGHMTICFGRGKTRYVHRLVLLAFVGPPPPGHECLHRDDVPGNNRLTNLRWGTRSENMIEAYENGCRG